MAHQLYVGIWTPGPNEQSRITTRRRSHSGGYRVDTDAVLFTKSVRVVVSAWSGKIHGSRWVHTFYARIPFHGGQSVSSHPGVHIRTNDVIHPSCYPSGATRVEKSCRTCSNDSPTSSGEVCLYPMHSIVSVFVGTVVAGTSSRCVPCHPPTHRPWHMFRRCGYPAMKTRSLRTKRKDIDSGRWASMTGSKGLMRICRHRVLSARSAGSPGTSKNLCTGNRWVASPGSILCMRTTSG